MGLHFWIPSYSTVWMNMKSQLLSKHFFFFLHLYLFSTALNTGEVHFTCLCGSRTWIMNLKEHLPSCKAVPWVLQGNRVTKGATREVLHYTYLLVISGGGVEGGCLAPKMVFALQDVGKKCQAKKKKQKPNRYFTWCGNESTAQQQTWLTHVQ